MLTFCYFDMHDTCIAAEQRETGLAMALLPNWTDFFVDGGQYKLPLGVSPLGYSAATLFPFAVRPFNTCQGGMCGV